MTKEAVKEKDEVVKLGDSTKKADLYMDYLVRFNKKGESSFLQVNEKEEVVLHQEPK
jgi:hypothetical protein